MTATVSGAAGQSPEAPVAKKIPHTTNIHGYTLSDDYFWLREKKNPEVMKYLEAENAYTEDVMKGSKAVEEKLYTEMLGRIKQTDLTVPYRLGEYFYYTRTEEGKQYPYYARKKGSLEGKEELLLDLNQLAEGKTYMALGAYAVSPDGNWLAFSLDSTGYRQYTLQVKDLRTGTLSVEHIDGVGAVAWAMDNKTLFYSTEDPVSKRSDKIWRHAVGNAASDLVYFEPDEMFDVDVSASLDDRMLFIGAFAKTSTEIRFLPADNPGGAFKVITPRREDHEYDADYHDGKLYIRTNSHARNFRVVTASLDDPSEGKWKEYIPHSPSVKVAALTFFANHLAISEREGGLSHLKIVDLKTSTSHRITTEEPDYTLALSTNVEANTTIIRFAYQSLVTPGSVYDYDMNTRKRTLMKRVDVLGGYDPSRYETSRVWATARDGTKVPISLMWKKDTKLDGTAPLLLYAYGSYGISVPPTFSSNRLSLVDRGVIYAQANIRGGGELGEDWRLAGRMNQKMNTFYDFIDCAEFLVKNKYTSSDRLVIQGGSAGGLLVGAVVNMRPDLFKAAVAQVPFVDVINTMLDASLPLTTAEYTEWGNPNEKPAFDYIRQYSPYDNIKAQNYPAMLVQVSYNDSQVPYWEGAKMVARLRVTKTDKNPLVLKSNLGAGHGGASGRYDALKETAFTYAFVLWQLGLLEKTS